MPGKCFRGFAFLERPPRGLRRLARRLGAVGEACSLGRQRLLGLVDLRAAESTLSSRAISSTGRSVNRRMKRPTSSSSVLRQNCQ